jgi:hypothetical protein
MARIFKNRYNQGPTGLPDAMPAWDDGICGL